MIITSLLDTDLYKFTMMQVVLHHFPGRAGRVPLQVPQPGRRPGAATSTQIRDEIARSVHAAVSRRRARLPARPALHQERLRRLPRPVPAQRRSTSRSIAAPSSNGRDRHHDPRAVAAHDPVRDPGARDRQRGLLPQHAAAARLRRRAAPAARRRSRCCSDDHALAGVRIADYGTRRRFSRHWHEEVLLHAARRSIGETASPAPAT